MKRVDRAGMSSGGNQVDVEKIRRHLAIAERRMGRRLFNGPTADNPSGKRRRVVRELDDALKQDLLDWVDGGDEEGRIAMLDLFESMSHMDEGAIDGSSGYIAALQGKLKKRHYEECSV